MTFDNCLSHVLKLTGKRGIIIEADNVEKTTSVPFSGLSWWGITGAIATGLFIGLGLVELSPVLARPFVLLFIAFVISTSLLPIVRRLSKFMPRMAAVIVIYVVLLLAIIFLIAALILPMTGQLENFIQQMPAFVEQAEAVFDENFPGSDSLASFLDRFASDIAELGSNVLDVPVSAVMGIFDGLLVLIVSLYLLISGHNIRVFLLSLFAGKARQRMEAVSTEIVTITGNYVNGVIINVVLIGIVTTIGLLIIGLPFAPVLGILAGLLEALPVVGSIIAAGPILLVAAFQSWPTFVITLVFILIVQQVEGNIIVPLVMQSQMKVPRFIIPIAILAGGLLMGILGALIAVPFIAVMQIIFIRLIVPFIRRKNGVVHEADPQ